MPAPHVERIVHALARTQQRLLAEGAHRAGRDRLYLYTVAGGSAAEVRTHLAVAAALGYVPDADTVEPDRLADRAAAMAWRLTHPRR